MSVTGTWQLRGSERIVTGNEALLGKKHLLVGLTRMRNEALLLPDTLDYLAGHVDAIVAYDDASTDDTVEILRRHPKVAFVVANQAWEQDIDARKLAEGRHRGLLLELARSQLPHDWMLCFDPDERVTGNLRGFVEGLRDDSCDAVRVKLFDAYMTQDDHRPYTSDQPLLDFRKFYGPEQRDILMLFRNRPEIVWAEGDGRTPRGMRAVKTELYSSITASRCRSPIGRRPATTTSSIFPTRPTARNGPSVKARASMPCLISAGRSTDGASGCSPIPCRWIAREGRGGSSRRRLSSPQSSDDGGESSESPGISAPGLFGAGESNSGRGP